MGRIKVTVHPLFVLLAVAYAIAGEFFSFFILTICAVIHELGHSIKAGSLGCSLNKITLMPFGAVVKGNIEGVSFIDQIKIALAGPFINVAVGVFFVAIWWVYPETYAFTDIAVESCFSMALVNFLPIFPLDGGRVIECVLCGKFGEIKGEKISKIVSLIFAILLFALFIISCFFTLNTSLLLFCVFVLVGTFGKARENRYLKVFKSISDLNLKNGAPFKKIGVDKSITVKKLVTLLDSKAINEVAVYDGDALLGVFSQKMLVEIISKGSLYDKMEKFL